MYIKSKASIYREILSFLKVWTNINLVKFAYGGLRLEVIFAIAPAASKNVKKCSKRLENNQFASLPVVYFCDTLSKKIRILVSLNSDPV